MGLFGGPLHDERAAGPRHFDANVSVAIRGPVPSGWCLRGRHGQRHEGGRRACLACLLGFPNPAAEQIGVKLVVQGDPGNGDARFQTGGHDLGLELTGEVAATSGLGLGLRYA